MAEITPIENNQEAGIVRGRINTNFSALNEQLVPTVDAADTALKQSTQAKTTADKALDLANVPFKPFETGIVREYLVGQLTANSGSFYVCKTDHSSDTFIPTNWSKFSVTAA